MPAIPPYIIEPIWERFSALLPDRVVFNKLVQILVFGCAYRRIADDVCSATTLRERRDEWIACGVIEKLRQIALEAYDRMIGLQLAEVAVDGCITKAPCSAARRLAKARWIEANRASSAPRRWMGGASP